MKILQTLSKILAFLPALLTALFGGIIGGVTVKKCSDKPELPKINYTIVIPQYEQDIQQIKAKQDSISRVLPTYDESIRFFEHRYGLDKNGSKP